MRKRILSFLLIFAFLITFLVSCSDNNANKTPDLTTSNSGEGEQTSAQSDNTPKINLPVMDFKGYEFRIMGRNSEHEKWTSIDIDTEEANGEPINDAVYERNRKVEEIYNVVIKNVSVFGPGGKIKTLIMAGGDSADLLTDSLNALSQLLTVGYLVDYEEVPYIDYEQPWWDYNLVKGLSIMNKVYLMTGDISIMDNVGTWAIGFNKDLVKEYSLANPYELVNEGKWTYDRMYEMMKPIPADLDGNGEQDDFDQYALVGEPYNTYVFLVGSGNSITTKDENDLPYLSIYNENTLLALEKVFDIMNDPTMTLLSTRVKGKYSHVFNECINKGFGEGKSLFWMGSCKVIEILRGYDVNFGLIPNPKLNEDQEHYYGSYSTGNLTAFSIPITNADLDRTGILSEALAAYSVYTLTSAYYDITLKGKSLRDTESEAMLDIIFSSRLYDLGAVFEWGGIFPVFAALTMANSRDFSSKYAALETNANAAIDKFIESLKIS